MGGSQGAKFFDQEVKDVVLNLSKKYKLKEVGVAHKDLETRKTVGSVVLKP